jgi:ATP-dependent Lon protease
MTVMGRHIVFYFTLALLSVPAFSQVADGQTPILPADPTTTQESRPKSIEENLEKFRIERENKEFREMIRRGEDSLKAADELASRLSSRGKLTDQDKKDLIQLEKNLKRIRSDLGGTDDKLDEEERDLLQSRDTVELTKKLRDRTADLLEELKRTTRFTISAAAIETANAALRVLRFMRLVN